MKQKRGKSKKYWKKSSVISCHISPITRNILFLVKSSMPWSDPAGHFFYLKFDDWDNFFKKAPKDYSPYNMDIHCSCNCAQWKYSGPAFYSKQDGYNFNNKYSTSERPKEPENDARVCKHANAVFHWLLQFNNFQDFLNKVKTDKGLSAKANIGSIKSSFVDSLVKQGFNEFEAAQIADDLNEENLEETLLDYNVIERL